MRRWILAAAAVLCLVLAGVFQWRAQEIKGQAAGCQDQMTLLLQEPLENVLLPEGSQNIRKDNDEQDELEFTLWGEQPGQSFTGAAGHSAVLTVILFTGSTQLLFPCDGILYDTDRQGCLLDRRAAEALFGSHEVLGEQIGGDSGSFRVRGVLPLEEGLVVIPANSLEGAFLDRITVWLGGRERQAMAELLGQYGYSGTPLRMDFYESFSWVKELVPGKWADFEGWKGNLEEKRQEWRVLANTKKYIPQMLQYRMYRSYHWNHGLSVLCLLVFLILLFYGTLGPYSGSR